MDADTILALRTAAVERNVKLIEAGETLSTKLVDVREVVRRAEAGEPIKDLLP